MSPALLGKWTSPHQLGSDSRSVDRNADQASPKHSYHNYASQMEESGVEIDNYVDVVEKIASIDNIIKNASNCSSGGDKSSSSSSAGGDRYALEHKYVDRGGVYHIGAEQLHCSPKTGIRCYQILVRPDVSEEALMSLSEALLLSSVTCGNKQSIRRVTPPTAGYHCSYDSFELSSSSSSSGKKNKIESSNGIHAASAANAAAPQRTAALECTPWPHGSAADGALSTGAAQQSALWASIRLLLSVNMQLQRCLVLYIQPSDAAKSTMGALNGNSKVVQSASCY